MAARAPPEVRQPVQLALEWYRARPLPDAKPEEAPGPGLSELSRRLVAAFDAGRHCDCEFRADGGRAEGADGVRVERTPAEPQWEPLCLAAHRVVLRRNSCLKFCGDGPMEQVPILVCASPESFRAVVRAHYLEVEGAAAGGALAAKGGPRAELAAIKAKLPEAECQALESVFGPLDAANWMPLRDALNTDRFADCSLQLAGGIAVPAHGVLIAGGEDGHFFSAALRWPGGDGGSGQRRSVAMPDGLSHEALLSLLRLRYGAGDVEVEHILEARHFAELFDWTAARTFCEAQLEGLLADAQGIDAESLLAVVAHAEESVALPPRLKAAALAAAVRQWSKVADAASAESSLPAGRRAELGALSKVRNRDGHICGSLEEYLHAASDDLSEWERGMATDAPAAARKQVERAWRHWHQVLFEYGFIFGAKAAEDWRARVAAARERLREERELGRGAEMRLPPGRVWFEASPEWREVPQNAICPGGLEYRFDMETGRNYARMIV